MASFLTPLLSDPGAFELRNVRTGRVVASRLATAFHSESRRTGLLKHTGLAPGDALVIAPTNAIHTWFMRFAIDVAFVTRDGRVVKIRTAMPPWRLAAAMKGYAVVELAAGALDQAGVRVGDRMSVERRSS